MVNEISGRKGRASTLASASRRSSVARRRQARLGSCRGGLRCGGGSRVARAARHCSSARSPPTASRPATAFPRSRSSDRARSESGRTAPARADVDQFLDRRRWTSIQAAPTRGPLPLSVGIPSWPARSGHRAVRLRALAAPGELVFGLFPQPDPVSSALLKGALSRCSSASQRRTRSCSSSTLMPLMSHTRPFGMASGYGRRRRTAAMPPAAHFVAVYCPTLSGRGARGYSCARLAFARSSSSVPHGLQS